MKITLSRINDSVLFQAQNERGHAVLVEGGTSVGGHNEAPSPTEYFIISQAACTAIDIVELLKKMRQPLSHLEIETDAQRAEDQVPKIFTGIHLHYKLYGDIKKEKAEKAITMSIEKYCTVSKMIDSVAKITFSFKIYPPANEMNEM